VSQEVSLFVPSDADVEGRGNAVARQQRLGRERAWKARDSAGQPPAGGLNRPDDARRCRRGFHPAHAGEARQPAPGGLKFHQSHARSGRRENECGIDQQPSIMGWKTEKSQHRTNREGSGFTM
jgi:hypothetical protein